IIKFYIAYSILTIFLNTFLSSNFVSLTEMLILLLQSILICFSHVTLDGAVATEENAFIELSSHQKPSSSLQVILYLPIKMPFKNKFFESLSAASALQSGLKVLPDF